MQGRAWGFITQRYVWFGSRNSTCSVRADKCSVWHALALIKVPPSRSEDAAVCVVVYQATYMSTTIYLSLEFLNLGLSSAAFPCCTY